MSRLGLIDLDRMDYSIALLGKIYIIFNLSGWGMGMATVLPEGVQHKNPPRMKRSEKYKKKGKLR